MSDSPLDDPVLDDPVLNDSPLVAARRLSKRYRGGAVAVAGLDLTVRRGEVVGLLGPNGAGKTTVLRMLLGLLRPSAGSVTVLGQPPGAPAGLAGVGALVEEPSFYPYLTGRQNLRVLARYAGAGRATGRARVDEALARVALSGRAGDKVGAYSLGMRQRLGIAAALLKQPQLLILDEPTNGLDARGVAEVRDLLGGLGRAGRGVLVASHHLAELERVCDRVVILHRGGCVAQGRVAELVGPRGLDLTVSSAPRARDVARALPFVAGAEAVTGAQAAVGAAGAGGRVRVDIDPALASELIAALLASGVLVEEVARRRRSLEDVFLTLTAEDTDRAGTVEDTDREGIDR